MKEPTLQEVWDGMCRKECSRRRGQWPPIGTCIRPKDHPGKCRPIENGMTAREAEDISRGLK